MPDERVLIPETQRVYVPGEHERIYMPDEMVYGMPRPIPLLKTTEVMLMPRRMIAPISQVSNPAAILDDKAWSLHDLMLRWPIWKQVAQNPLVQRGNAYVMNEPWRWCLRSIACTCSLNHIYQISVAPAIYKENFRVSSRTYEASLIDPVGFHFQDYRFQDLVKQLNANESAAALRALAHLVFNLSQDYQPDVPIPSDCSDWLGRMCSPNISLAFEDSIINDPCLLQYYGRYGFTNHVDDLIRLVLNCNYDASGEEVKLSSLVLKALSQLRGYDGRFWGDIMIAEPLFRHNYEIASYGSLPPRESLLMKKKPVGFLHLGQMVCRVLRGGLRHSLDTKVKLINEIRILGPYNLENVVEYQHVNFPDFPGTVIKILLSGNHYYCLNMRRYFHPHPGVLQ